MRPPPGDNVKARETALLQIAAKVTPEAITDTIVAFEPFATRNITAFQPIFTDAPVVDLPYWTEAAMLSEAGVNVVVYGPGDVEQAHKPNEFVTHAHLMTAAAAYQRAISGSYL